MAIKYIPFYPEPIEGQAVLNNFKRTLRYHGIDVLADDLRRGMPLYEMETKEQVGVNLQGNLVIRGECVSACAWLREQGKKIDLVYIEICSALDRSSLSSQEQMGWGSHKQLRIAC